MPRTSPLHETHVSAGATFVEADGWSMPASFEDVATEYEALRSGAALLDLSSRAKLRVCGADRVRFLQNMLTNDIQSLRPGHGCRAAKLTVQGRMEAGLHVLCLAGEIWCDLGPGPAEQMVAGLRKRIILEDALIEDVTDAWALLAVQGPAAAAALEAVGVDVVSLQEELQHGDATISGMDVRVVCSDHSGEGGFDIWVRAQQATSVWQAILSGSSGVRPAGVEALDVRRIEAGIPWHGREITPERFPQEIGLDEGWISYTKGCYLGQETISRIHHMGHVNRHLRGFLLDGAALPARGSALFVQDTNVGELTSTTRSPQLGRPVALGYVRREFASPSTAVEVGDGAERGRAEVTSLPLA
ncbi:MAG: aminomethyltransferase family protein [Candidatus Krumholzibacteriia bacterium]